VDVSEDNEVRVSDCEAVTLVLEVTEAVSLEDVVRLAVAEDELVPVSEELALPV
jgi:hypothetical protein